MSIRNGSRNWIAWPAALLALGLALPAFAHRIEKRFKVDMRPVVTVRNFHGKVTVKSWQKPEVVVVANHVSEKTEVDAEQSGNRIDILTHHLAERTSPNELEANYEITVPEETELQVRTDSGFVIIERVAGDMIINTVAADVNLTEVAGYLVIETVNGSLMCTRCAGRIDFKSIGGNVNLVQPIANTIRASTSAGSIRFDGDFLRGGVYLLKTNTGAIEVSFAANDSFNLAATSMKGEVQSDVKFKPPQHDRRQNTGFSNSLFGTYNEGLARVELTSYSGIIRIVKRD